jgi:hypothetical protein
MEEVDRMMLFVGEFPDLATITKGSKQDMKGVTLTLHDALISSPKFHFDILLPFIQSYTPKVISSLPYILTNF